MIFPIGLESITDFFASLIKCQKLGHAYMLLGDEGIGKKTLCNYLLTLIMCKQNTGCGICKNVCKSNAITMKLNDDGFYYPQINKELCTDCGACARVCHYTNENQTYDFSGNVFAVQSKDKKILEYQAKL